MKSLIYVFLLVSAVTSAVAGKPTGSVEGTIVDQENRPLRNIEIDIKHTDYEYASPNRFLMRTNRDGHFTVKVPAGVYRVKLIAPGGKVLKEITDVHVDTGKILRLDSTLTVPDPTPATIKGRSPQNQ